MVGACRCPGRPHAEDWVELATSIPIGVGAGVLAAVRASGGDEVRLAGMMAQVYVSFGITAWSFMGEPDSPDQATGWPIPVDPMSSGWTALVQRLLPWDNGGALVADKADELYSENVLRPLTGRTLTQSRDGQTDGLTYPIPPSQPTPPARSRRSSRTATAGRPSEAPAP